MKDENPIASAIEMLATRIHIKGGDTGPASLAAAVWEISNSLDSISEALFDVASAIREANE